MTSFDEKGRVALRNKLLGLWAAEKLGLSGQAAESYSDILARQAFEPMEGDVLGRVRRDFDAAAVAATDEQILAVMNDLMLRAGNQMPTGGGTSSDVAAVVLARTLSSG